MLAWTVRPQAEPIAGIACSRDACHAVIAYRFGAPWLHLQLACLLGTVPGRPVRHQPLKPAWGKLPQPAEGAGHRVSALAMLD